jgi:hypothetical protein
MSLPTKKKGLSKGKVWAIALGGGGALAYVIYRYFFGKTTATAVNPYDTSQDQGLLGADQSGVGAGTTGTTFQIPPIPILGINPSPTPTPTPSGGGSNYGGGSSYGGNGTTPPPIIPPIIPPVIPPVTPQPKTVNYSSSTNYNPSPSLFDLMPSWLQKIFRPTATTPFISQALGSVAVGSALGYAAQLLAPTLGASSLFGAPVLVQSPTQYSRSMQRMGQAVQAVPFVGQPINQGLQALAGGYNYANQQVANATQQATNWIFPVAPTPAPAPAPPTYLSQALAANPGGTVGPQPGVIGPLTPVTGGRI